VLAGAAAVGDAGLDVDVNVGELVVGDDVLLGEIGLSGEGAGGVGGHVDGDACGGLAFEVDDSGDGAGGGGVDGGRGMGGDGLRVDGCGGVLAAGEGEDGEEEEGGSARVHDAPLDAGMVLDESTPASRLILATGKKKARG